MSRDRYKPLVDAYAAHIRAGRLSPGTRLPTHRRLAAHEGIALVTATRIYAELKAMGLVSGETGRGTFVREIALPPDLGLRRPDASADVVDLAFNAPSLPGQGDALRAALRRVAASGDIDALLRYQPHGGRRHERATAARHLAARGVDVGADRVLFVDGAQHGLAATVMALLAPGDVVAVDALTYPGFRLLGALQRLELVAIPAAGSGPDLDALERLCRRRDVKAVYTMPTMHNPLGWVTGAAHRRRLAAIARRHDLLLIEDAAYAFLVADAPPPLAALAPERTVHVSGLSKSVATGLRVGFVAAPADRVPKLEAAIRATTWNTPGVMTAIACGWIDDGTVARLEAARRHDAARRQAIATRRLAGLGAVAHPASYFAWVPLDDAARADRIAMSLSRERIAVSTAEPFAATSQPPRAIRLALGSVDEAVLDRALKRVAATIVEHAG